MDNNNRKPHLTTILAVSLSAVLVLSSCGAASTAGTSAGAAGTGAAQQESTVRPWEDSDVKAVVQAAGKMRAQDDFNQYVNRDWILKNDIPDGYSQNNSFYERQLAINDQMEEILSDDDYSWDKEVQHDADLVQTYSSMWLDWDERDRLGYEPLRDLLDPIRDIDSLDELTDFLSKTSTAISIEELANFAVSGDWNDASSYTVYIERMNLPLQDAAYYQQMSEEDVMEQPYYNEEGRYFLKQIGYSDREATDIIEGDFHFEKEVAQACMTTEEQNAEDAIEKENNPMTAEELKEKAGDFPIMAIAGAYKVDGADSYILTEPGWLEQMASLYTEKNLEYMKDYLVLATLFNYTTLVDRDGYEKESEVLNGISGASGMIDDSVAAVDAVDDAIPMQLGRCYTSRFVSADTKDEVTQLTEKIVDGYRTLLESEDFLSEATRKEAIRKLDHLTARIAYPDTWEDDSSLVITPYAQGGSLIQAHYEIGQYAIDQMAAKVGTKVDPQIWSGSPQDVNAYYDPNDNSITICGGILGGSFYRDDMSTEEQYARIGDVIAHEISHAFDSNGRRFDETGTIRNWWTKEDAAAFQKRAQALVDYYNAVSPFDGYYCSGTLVEGEAIADLAAMKLILQLASEEDGFDYKTFFENFAANWRTISTVQTEEYALSQDNHPLAYLRVNAVLQQFEPFYDTYGVKEGDGMYLSKEQRLEVW